MVMPPAVTKLSAPFSRTFIVIAVSISLLGQRTRDWLLKNKWPPGLSVAATLSFHARAFEQARCQQAHHQMVLVERMFMAKSIAAKDRMRNRFEKSLQWLPLPGLWHIATADGVA
ncbi:hypothetical protein [Mesorhizobium erdmanii]|uniref:hypothetical protein n=1 Tax=Mesorhizobium erdmanii TaxID=1777866 RepID=UPI001427A668|nr:hypothetical protein [Mesorhizobium erdmanii]